MISGTVYIQQPGSTHVIIDGKATESTFIDTSITKLTIANAASISVSASVTIQEIAVQEDKESTNICSLAIPASITLTTNTMGMQTFITPHKKVICYRFSQSYMLSFFCQNLPLVTMLLL